MTTLNINGQRVKVGDEFLTMTPEQQNAVVDEIASKIGVQAGGQEPSAWRDAAQQFGENFNRGIYSAINAPTALANLGMKVAGSDYRFERPLQTIAPGADQAIMDVPEAQTAAGRVAGVIGEYAGANSLPAMGVAAAAPKLATSLAGSQSLAGQVIGNTAKAVARNPGKAAAGEALSTVGAGVGASIARDLAPGNDLAEFGAATIGGIAAPGVVALSPTNLARKGVQKIKGRLSPEAARAAARRNTSAMLRENMTPDTARSIQDTIDIQRDVPGYNPSLAEATETPDFIKTQQVFEGDLSGPDLNRAANRYKANDQAVAQASQRLSPQSYMTSDDAFGTGRSRLQSVYGRLDNAQRRADMNAQAISDRVQSGVRRSSLGYDLRESLIAERAAVKQRMAQTADEMGLNDPRAYLDFEDVKEQLEAAVEPRSRLADRSALPTGIINDIKAMDGKASIVDLMELRTRIQTDIREAQRMPTGEKRVPALQKLQSALDNATDELISRTADPDLSLRLRNFRKQYRDDFVLPFEQGAAGAVLKRDITGAYKIPDEQVAKTFFDGWNETAAKQFRQTFKNSPYANRTMEAAALDDLYHFAARDGEIDLNRLAQWQRKNAGVLQSFPNIQQRLSDIEGALSDIAQRRAVIASRRKAVEQSYLAREISRIDNPVSNTTPERAIVAAIDPNPAKMRRLMRAIKSPDAKNAVAREVWNHVLDQADPVEYMRKNAPALSVALGEKFKSANRLARAINKNRLVPRPAGQAMDANPVASIENSLGTGLNQLSSRIFAVKSGRTSSRYVAFDIMGRAFRAMTAGQARELLKEVLYDPQAATDLATVIEAGQMTEKQARRLYAFLIGNGIVATVED